MKQTFVILLAFLLALIPLTSCAVTNRPIPDLPDIGTGDSTHTPVEPFSESDLASGGYDTMSPGTDTTVPAPATEAPVTDAPATDAPATEAPATTPVTDPPAPVTEPPAPVTDSPVTTERRVQNPDADVRISFLAAGDNIGHEAVFTDAKNRANGSSYDYNFAPMYADIASMIRSADISFINQETLMGGSAVSGGSYSGYPDFNSPQDMGKTLVDLGFDVINIANNHMMDWGATGLSETIRFWKTQPVLTIGGYTSPEDYNNVRILESKGVRIAFLSYTELINYAHMGQEKGSNLQIPYPYESTIRAQVAAAKQQADVVLVSMHWGNEDQYDTTASQKKWTALFAELGVDAVIGHHPHVVQPVEWVNRNDGGRMLVVYSLGNLLSTMLYGRNMVGGIITFDICMYKDGTVGIESPVFVPTVTHYSKTRDSLQIYQLEHYSDALASQHGCVLNDASFTYARACRYITDNIRPEFLPAFLK